MTFDDEGRPLHYILGPDGEPVAVPLMVWAQWFESDKRRVALDEVGGFTVSTIFLGLDHNWSGVGPPVLWETMVFSDGASWDGFAERYTSHEAALNGHKRAVAIVQRIMQEHEARRK